MSDTILICNVGSRDVQLPADRLASLPPELVQRDNLVPRLAGAYLKEHVATYQEAIRLPMIEKAIQYICPNEKGKLWVHLLATDQPESVEARFRNSDTIRFAEVIQQVLATKYAAQGMVKKQVRLHVMQDNPADYDRMHDFYWAVLPKIKQHVADEVPVWLLIAGGTPQMTTMLLFDGIEVFGAAARPMYVLPDKDRPIQLDIGKQIAARALQRNMAVLLRAYAYQTAQELLAPEQEAGAVLEDWQMQVLSATLTYAAARRNLDLEGAIAALDRAITATRQVREQLLGLQQELAPTAQTRTVILLRETLYLAQVAAETGNWQDLLTRLFRFAEGLHQHMAEQLGVQWSSPERTSFQEQWWQGLPPELVAQFPERTATRESLRVVNGYLAAQAEKAKLLAALQQLEQVERPVALRNRVVHDFTPLSQPEIEQKAGATLAELVAAMREALRLVTGLDVPPQHPYAARVNPLCQQVLEGMK